MGSRLWAFGLAVAALFAPLAATPAGASGTWVKTPTPLPYNTRMTEVACASPTSCNAADSDLAPPYGGRRERWDGSSWHETFTPAADSMSCPATKFCVAAATNMLMWRGSGWTTSAAPKRDTSRAFGTVECSSAAFCMAIGGGGADVWNGTKWSFAPGGAPPRQYKQLTCASAHLCIAVGVRYDSHGYAQTMAEVWNGSAWKVTPTPNATKYDFFTDVACINSSSCFAVGVKEYLAANSTATYVARWNGTSWSAVGSPNPKPTNAVAFDALNAVSCASSTLCVAVGYERVSTFVYRPLVERWNGGKWVVMTAPGASTSSLLRDVSCPRATTFCMAVGEASTPNVPYAVRLT